MVVSDGTVTDSETITVTVTEANSAPVLAAIGNQTIAEGTELTFTATATDADLPANTLSFSLADGLGAIPTGASITAGGLFSWTPTEAQGPGTYTFDVVVSDGTVTDSETITVTVTEANSAPILAAIGNQTIAEGTELSFTATATDTDLPANTLTFSLADGTGAVPTGATITAGGLFSWTPTEVQGPGTYTFDVVVSDGTVTDSETITVTVTEANAAPVLAAIGNQTIAEGTELSFTATATDADLPANTLSFSLADGTGAIPTGAAITAGGLFTWTPTEAQGPGVYSFDVVVSDGTVTDSETISVTVIEANNAPVLAAIGNQTVDEGSTLNFSAPATDSDLPANTLTYSLDAVSLAAGMTIDAVTGDFSWTPGESQDGPHSVTITVVDDGTGLLSDSETFTITVNEINNNDPFATGDSITVAEGGTIAILDSGQVSILANDGDADLPNDTLSVLLGVGPGYGSLTLYADGTFSYTHDGSENFSDAFTYIVSDADGGVTDTGIVSITITPVNDNGIGPVTDSDGAADNVAENAGIGTAVGITASATDPDITDTVSYSLSGNAGGRFGIDSATGVVSIAAGLDYETAVSHTIVVLATSSDGSTSSQTFTISVSDSNEFGVSAIIDSDGSADMIAENLPGGAAVGVSALATDGDGTDTVSYSLSDDAGGRFTIDSVTGIVSTAGSLDYETGSSHTITVIATSTDGSTSSQAVTISVSDVNETVTVNPDPDPDPIPDPDPA